MVCCHLTDGPATARATGALSWAPVSAAPATPQPPFVADPGARRSLRARLRGGPLARAIAKVDVRLYRVLREDAQSRRLEEPIRRFSSLGEHAGLWLAIGAAGVAVECGAATAGSARRDRCWSPTC